MVFEEVVMLSVIVILLGIILYAIVYWVYVKWFDCHVIMCDPKRETPAHTYMDGVEFFPSNRYVLFGFQWKSIAALGPVTGPIIALQWGWLPGLLWILFGTIFIGWIHDYGSLIVSARHEGASFGPITYELISPRARTILLWYILWYIILILSSFCNIVATQVFPTYPVSPVPVLIVAIVGILVGYATYKLKVNIVYTTVIAVIIMFLGIWAGMALPYSVPLPATGAFPNALDFWIFMTLLFCFLGAVLPIWVFIQPINYLSFYLVYAGIIGIIIGAFVGQPTFERSMSTGFFTATGTGPPLWPMLFVTIACGAISGWHSLIGSSVTSKQLDTEPDAHFIGGGAMLAEGILALVSLTAVAIFTDTTLKTKLPATVVTPTAADKFVGGGTGLLEYLGIPLNVGNALTAVMLIILAITIMHIGLRITRLVLSDLAGPRFGGTFKNKYFSAILVCIIVYILTSPHTTGGGPAVFSYIWGTFGGANQLMAGLALMIVSLWLTREKRPTIYTIIPMLFMLVTTLSALTYLAYDGMWGSAGYLKSLKVGTLFAVCVNIFLLILGLFMCYEGAKAFKRLRAKPKEETAKT